MVVFGAYDGWTDKDSSMETYCAYPPYMCAFVLLILSWTLVPVIICALCWCMCAGVCCMAAMDRS